MARRIDLSPKSPYGRADHEQIENGIGEILSLIDGGQLSAAQVANRFASTLLEINSTVPVQHRQRFLISDPLESLIRDVLQIV